VLIDPINPGANGLFEAPVPVPLDGYPIEYGRAIEYEQQTSITIKIINNSFVSFMVSFPSTVLLQGSNIYSLFQKLHLFHFLASSGLIQAIGGDFPICTLFVLTIMQICLFVIVFLLNYLTFCAEYAHHGRSY